MFFKVLLLFAISVTAFADIWGVDVSTLMSNSTASCLKSLAPAGTETFVIPRAFKSSGNIDTNACPTLESALAVGINRREAYIFPCPSCSLSAAGQIQNTLDNLRSNCANAFTNFLWLDIEGAQYWLNDYIKNQEFFESLVDACLSDDTYQCGIYASKNSWQSLFGSIDYTYAKASTLALWYPHYENTPNPSFSDWTPYGGWTAPTMKQYQGTTTVCDMGVDYNWAPATY